MKSSASKTKSDLTQDGLCRESDASAEPRNHCGHAGASPSRNKSPSTHPGISDDPYLSTPPIPSRRFHFLDLSYPDVVSNLALDEALLIEAEESGTAPILRIWESPTIAVILGASGRLHEDIDAELCRAEGIEIARRSSGGGTVMIGPGALNFTVVLPNDFAPGLAAVDKAQVFVLERVAEAIRRSGAPAVVLGSGDLTIDARKFSGSAQRRLKHHFLVHASLLYTFPIDIIARYTRLPKRQPTYRDQRPHDEFLTNLNLSREAIVNAIKAAWLGVEVAEKMEVPDTIVSRLVAEKFGLASWVERL